MPLTFQEDQESQFNKFVSDYLPEILNTAGYDELYGHQLTATGEFFSEEIHDVLIYKFLKARDWDLDAAREQLTKTLQWRKVFNPLAAGFKEEHDSKFDSVGVLTKYPNGNNNEVITWNVYGGPGTKELFDDLDKFIRYRIGLMERGLQLLDWTRADDIQTSSYISQIHDYEGVSFLRFDSKTKAASKKVVQLFQDYYPELLNKKFFVNVPSLMAWIYDFVKRWLPTETTKKFSMIHNGKDLGESVEYTASLPVKYGGKGAELVKQNVTEVKPTDYTTYLLQQEFTNEVD